MGPAKTVKKKNSRNQRNILWFKEISIADVPIVGGKNASLGEMYSKLGDKGIRIPNGFAVTANVYWSFLRAAGLDRKIKKIIKDLDVKNVRELSRVGKEIRDLILGEELPSGIKLSIVNAYRKLSEESGRKNSDVAVRSSATAEDLPDASFAGQQETYLNVAGEDAVLHAVKKCIASLFTNRAISYREAAGFDHMNVALSVAVQQMVRSDLDASGVMFTMDTESGFRGVVLMNASYGLGEYVVKGRVTPDQFYVFKDGVRRGKKAIIEKKLGTKEVKLVYGKNAGTKQAVVPKSERNRFSVSDIDVLTLAKWAMTIEEHYGKPQDIEWAKDGRSGKIFIVQSRPETVKARADANLIEKYQLKKEGKLLLAGMAIGSKIGAGKVRIIEHPKQMKNFQAGEVLVTRITDPDWEPIMRIASAIVTEQGGKTSHAAIVSREIGVPAIVGAHGARKILRQGREVTADCSKGDEGRIFAGILPFEVKRTKLSRMPKTKTRVAMNVGDPDHAFDLSFLPHNGVGLARLEFIFSNFIQIHPLALIHYDSLKDKRAKKKIRELTRGYDDKREYCIDKLAQGVARIATAFYPEEVIVRLSDFKTNEYRSMIGGKEFEPVEENPMIGWRGASRYYSKEYKEAFRLECEAMKRVRNVFGLENVTVMVPFCRTPEEGKKVLDLMAEYGLKRGENGLKVYVMCEIPSNVILAEDFAKIFDGFSIGSNDLTQMTLAVDRDSELVSHVFDERNEAVKTLIRDVIRVAKKHGKYIGICGQAPSDYPEFAEFLVREGIESISLNPDTVVEGRRRIAEVEKTIGRTGKKTNTMLLGLLAAFGIMSAGFIGLGVGCANLIPPTPSGGSGSLLPDIAPSLLRERAAQKVLLEKNAEQAALKATLKVTTFANFTLQYPASWTVEQWNGGATLSQPASGEYVSIFKQLLGHPVPSEKKRSVTVGGVLAVRYESAVNGSVIQIVEIPLPDGGILEMNGKTALFDEFLATFAFDGGAEFPDRPLTHWDIREGRACIQVIAYARQSPSQECIAFSTPCDVPEGWEVCDANDE